MLYHLLLLLLYILNHYNFLYMMQGILHITFLVMVFIITLSFMDVYNRYTWIYFVQSKSDVFFAFLKFKPLVERSLGQSILRLQTNGVVNLRLSFIF